MFIKKGVILGDQNPPEVLSQVHVPHWGAVIGITDQSIDSRVCSTSDPVLAGIDPPIIGLEQVPGPMGTQSMRSVG